MEPPGSAGNQRFQGMFK